MANTDDLAKRIEKLEKPSPTRFFLQYVLAPLVTAALTIPVTLYTANTQTKIQGIDVAQKMLPMLFVDDPDEMLATKNMLLVVVDKPLGKVIDDIVNKRLLNQMNASLANKDTVAAAKLVVAAQNASDGGGQSVLDTMRHHWKGSDEAAQKFVRARQEEVSGYDKLDHGDFQGAHQAFENSKKEFPTFHAVDEISHVLKNNMDRLGDTTVKRRVLDTIFKKYGDYRLAR